MINLKEFKTRILVTGASGFVAEHLLPLLKSDSNFVVGLDRLEKASGPVDTFVSCDINEAADSVSEACRCDIIIHLAAARADWGISDAQFYRDNVDATNTVLQYAVEYGVKRFIFLSSISVFGQSEKSFISEYSEYNPINAYGRSKMMCEEAIAENLEIGSYIIIRPTVIYGPSDPKKTGLHRATDNNVFRMIKQIKRKQFFIPGNPFVVKSTCYVENIASFVDHCVHCNHPHSFYLFADEDQYDIQTLFKIITNHLGLSTYPLVVPMKLLRPIGYIFDILGRLFGRNFPVNSARIETVNKSTQLLLENVKHLDFAYPCTAEQGLKNTVSWIEDGLKIKDRSNAKPKGLSRCE